MLVPYLSMKAGLPQGTTSVPVPGSAPHIIRAIGPVICTASGSQTVSLSRPDTKPHDTQYSRTLVRATDRCNDLIINHGLLDAIIQGSMY